MKAKRWNRLSLRAKMSIIYIFANVVILVVNLILLSGINSMTQQIDSVYRTNRHLNELSASLSGVQTNMTEYLSVKTSDSLENFYRSEQEFRLMVEELNTRVTEDDFDRMERNVRLMSENYLDIAEQTIEAKRGRNVEKYRQRYESATALYENIHDYIESLNTEQFKRNSEEYSMLIRAFGYFETASVIVIFLVILGNVVLITRLTGAMIQPLMTLAVQADAVAKGNFEVKELPVQAQDEIGIGREKEFKDMADSYQEALSALAITTGSVAHVEDLPIGCEYETDYPVELEHKLFEAVEQGELNNAISSARQYFDWMAETYPDSLMEIRTKVLEFVLWAEHLAYEKGGMTYQFRSRQDYLPFVMSAQEPAVLREWFSDKIVAACRNVISKRTEKSNSIIETAKEYLQTNFAKDISLDDVSRIVNISPYYFSKLFKEDTGENFIEYLTAIRINKAKELLDTSEYSMKEICAMVGYSDPNYFSRTFKKNVGVTPTEYKESRKKG